MWTGNTRVHVVYADNGKELEERINGWLARQPLITTIHDIKISVTSDDDGLRLYALVIHSIIDGNKHGQK